MTWHLPKGDEFLPRISVEELQQAYERERGGWPKIRLLVAIKRKEGQSMDAIAEHLQISRTAVNETLHRFQERGSSAKDDEKRSGRPRRLGADQLKQLRQTLISGPRKGTNALWTTRQIIELLRGTYHLEYTPRHMRRLMHQLGFSLQKPRPRHYKTDIEQQAHFKKTSGKSSENTGNADSRSFFWTNAR